MREARLAWQQACLSRFPMFVRGLTRPMALVAVGGRSP